MTERASIANAHLRVHMSASWVKSAEGGVDAASTFNLDIATYRSVSALFMSGEVLASSEARQGHKLTRTDPGMRGLWMQFRERVQIIMIQHAIIGSKQGSCLCHQSTEMLEIQRATDVSKMRAP